MSPSNVQPKNVAFESKVTCLYVDDVLARLRYRPEPLSESDPSESNTKYPLDATGPRTAIPAIEKDNLGQKGTELARTRAIWTNAHRHFGGRNGMWDPGQIEFVFLMAWLRLK